MLVDVGPRFLQMLTTQSLLPMTPLLDFCSWGPELVAGAQALQGVNICLKLWILRVLILVQSILISNGCVAGPVYAFLVALL